MGNWTEKEKKLFSDANEGKRKAQNAIIDLRLFGRWVEWNIDCATELEACRWALDSEEAKHPLPQAKFLAEMEKYKAMVEPYAQQRLEHMSNECMDLLFDPKPRTLRDS